MLSNNYIGIPFKYKGRTTDGLDCWGLVRLIYKDEYDITLPSFSDEYEDNQVERIGDLISQYKEGWESIAEPEEGSLVLFRVMGVESHVGVCISSTHFIHAREGFSSAIEAFDSPSWKKRIVGHFKYSEKSNAVLNVVPHPLRTERFTMPIPQGIKLDELVTYILKEYNIADELKSEAHITVNGIAIHKDKWQETVLNESDKIEYRSVPTGSAGRMLAVLAIAIAAPWAVTYMMGGAMTAAGVAAAAAASPIMFAVGTVAINMLGSALVNAIAPVRPLSAPADPGSSERQLMLDGAQNQVNKYGAIPVILGKVKVAPPLGAVNYLTYENERDSYVSMLLTWGYGPLSIDESTLKIGEIPLSNYTNYTIQTDNRKIALDAVQQQRFDSIYSKDITQVYTNIELVCDGNPDGTPVVTTEPYMVQQSMGEGEYIWVEAGTRQITTYAANTPGPWYEAASTETVDSFTVAINFPSGLRRIVVKGDGSGNNEKAPTSFRVEIFYNSTWYFLNTFSLGADAPKKDAFTFTKTYSIVAGQLPVNNGLIMRIRRETGDNTEDNPTYRYYHTSVLQNVAFSRNAAPAVDPVGSKIAKTAFKIKATDQLNGSIAGINAIVQTYCKAWNGAAWVDASTSNPAALFRYVLEHSGNSQRITSPSTKFDLVQLQYWSNYCTTKGFEYNSVLATQRSILEVLRDICAAGRASPALVDGKWTVIIDEPKPNIIQHFTPHNSWDFESTKALPKMPDGLRVNYFDEAQDYQESEVIVYNTGKSASDAALFESIQLPGVTKLSSVIDHAKWHFAQAKLRPEVYTLNADIEYLVCNRGDRVKVMHDVPMWGIGSGRIKNRLSSTSFELDEELPLEVGKAYTLRVRSSNGSSVTRTITAVGTSDYYTQISVTVSTTEAEVNAGDLFMFGEINSEASDLIVLNIEPTSNKSARLTLVDYGVNNVYNIFNDYLSLTSNTVFQGNITLPAKLLVESFGEKIPTITKLVSDESVMELIAPGVFKYNLAVSYVNAPLLPKTTSLVEVQWDYAAATDGLNQRSATVPYEKGLISVPDVSEGEIYRIRLRYISTESRVGLWTDWVNHTIVGKTNPPSTVTGFTVTPDFTTGNLNLKWGINPEIDVNTYEVRTEDANWGTASNRVFFGNSTNCIGTPTNTGEARVFYIRALDLGGNYSLVSASQPFSTPRPNSPANLSYSYGTTSNTNSTVTFSWNETVATFFAIKQYIVTLSRPGAADEIITTLSTKYTTTADWLGNATLSVVTVDYTDGQSLPALLTASKYVPLPVISLSTEIVDNNVLLKWVLPAITSLPVSHVLIKRGATWEAADKVIGEKDGTFTSVFELVGGKYNYWIAVVDTDERQSIPVAVAATVSQPPDFVFNAEYISSLSATKVNAEKVVNSDNLLMLVNTTQSWADHFSTNSWVNPQGQIDAGYPIYAQPSTTTASYQEVFDYGQVLSSSSITVSYTGDILADSPEIYAEIETRLSGGAWSTAQRANAIFATNFQEIRVTIRVVAGTLHSLYLLRSLVIRLDNKQVSDAGSINALSTDTLGSIVNFNKEIIDVQSVVLTPSGTTALTAVYDLFDTVVTGTYSITSGICTVNAVGHSLETGQNVRLAFTTGTASSGVYTITKISSNQYSVVATAQAATSGNVTTYPQSMRVYVFNSTTGTRQTSKVSWSIRGY